MLISVLLFAVGLVLLIKGGDWFVDGATGIAKRFDLPDIVVGATVVSVGTTLPEVMVSATGALVGSGAMSYGNAIGSIICNTALICALTFTIRPCEVDRDTFRTPVAFFFIAAIVYVLIALLTGEFSRFAGFGLLLLFIVYMIITVRQALADRAAPAAQDAAPAGKLWKLLLLLIVGAAAIAVGARLLVDNGTKIAEAMGVPESVIALTFVALGTSLPELVTAITSLVKGHGALSLGNIIGANLFNLVLVTGASASLAPFKVPASKMIGELNSSFVVDIPVMMAVMLILTVPALRKGKLTRAQGILLLAIYVGFCVYQFAC